MAVFVNRVLNLKKIKAIGFDMDYTLVEYQTENFEELVFNEVLKSLVSIKNYPKKILDLDFNFDLVIQGLVLDKEMGNALKLSRFGKVKKAFHGKKELSFSETQKVYQKLVIDLNDPNIQSLDTSFSISNGVLFLSLVEEKNNGT